MLVNSMQGVQNIELAPNTLCEVVCDLELAEIQGAGAGYLEASIGDVIRVVYVREKGEDIGWLYGVLVVERSTGDTPRTCGWIAAWAVRRMRPPRVLCAGMNRMEEEQSLHEDAVSRPVHDSGVTILNIINIIKGYRLEEGRVCVYVQW